MALLAVVVYAADVVGLGARILEASVVEVVKQGGVYSFDAGQALVGELGAGGAGALAHLATIDGLEEPTRALGIAYPLE